MAKGGAFVYDRAAFFGNLSEVYSSRVKAV